MVVMSRYRGRFAPSPTGPLHFGSLLTALGSWLLARQAGGEWWVRIEDVDPPREVAGAAQEQLQALQDFGLIADALPVCQSTRHALYDAALQDLLQRNLAFECHCSRSDLSEHGGIHHACVAGRHRPDPAVRLRVASDAVIEFDDALQGAQHQDVHVGVGDFVLRRTDGLWAYQLAVVVDDAQQQITHVVRGADLLDSTPRQILLQRALGLPTPHYLHLPLVTDAQGNKLSKSHAAMPVDGRRPMPALQLAWKALGQPPLATQHLTEPQSFLAEARQAFDPGRLPVQLQHDFAATHNNPSQRAV